MLKKIMVVGGAGFIGSHAVIKILENDKSSQVFVYDNFSSGTTEHLSDVLSDSRLKIIKGDVKDLETLTKSMAGVSQVWHFASNPDIAKAMTDPTVDFWEGTYLTQNVLEAIRINGVAELIYASGSGVYGETGMLATGENYSPLRPISTYGASKLAGEMLICSYCYMFGLTARAYRFANVVGDKQTHGVGFDFVRRLKSNPNELRILGDGTQSKSYIHVNDVLEAIFHTKDYAAKPFDVYNVATGYYITVTEIADIAVGVCKLNKKDVNYQYTGGDRGWKGDVPLVRFDLSKIYATGWKPKYNSAQALEVSMEAMLGEIENGK